MSGSDEANDTGAGYKRPPSGTQFPKGKSGNPRGRPKGRRNVANVTKDLLSRRVKVHFGGKTHEMTAAEAIFRVLANKAAQGNGRAIALFAKLTEMAGLNINITDEERQKNGKRRRRPFTPEEQDLAQASALERNRQRYLAMAEWDADPLEAEQSPFPITPDLKRGDEFAAKRKFDDALAAYRCELDRCRTELSANPDQTAAQYNFRRAVARIGLLANTLLFEGEFKRALEIADEAIRESESDFWISVTDPLPFWQPNKVWLQLIRAEALLFLNRWQEAENFFLHFNTGWRECYYTSWELTIMRDFVEFRRKGYVHPVMARVEGHYYEAGWVRDLNDPPACGRSNVWSCDGDRGGRFIRATRPAKGRRGSLSSRCCRV